MSATRYESQAQQQEYSPVINLSTAYNGMQSSMRNMFLVSSIGVVLVGVSQKFGDTLVPLFIALAVLSVAVWIGLQGMADFEAVRMRRADAQTRWNRWRFVTYAYVGIITLIVAWTLKTRFLAKK